MNRSNIPSAYSNRAIGGYTKKKPLPKVPTVRKPALKKKDDK